jgi:dipeptide/tripeptide permease
MTIAKCKKMLIYASFNAGSLTDILTFDHACKTLFYKYNLHTINMLCIICNCMFAFLEKVYDDSGKTTEKKSAYFKTVFGD